MMRVVFLGGCGIALFASGLKLWWENRTDRQLCMLTAFVTVLGLALFLGAMGLALPEGFAGAHPLAAKFVSCQPLWYGLFALVMGLLCGRRRAAALGGVVFCIGLLAVCWQFLEQRADEKAVSALCAGAGQKAEAHFKILAEERGIDRGSVSQDVSWDSGQPTVVIVRSEWDGEQGRELVEYRFDSGEPEKPLPTA